MIDCVYPVHASSLFSMYFMIMAKVTYNMSSGTLNTTALLYRSIQAVTCAGIDEEFTRGLLLVVV